MASNNQFAQFKKRFLLIALLGAFLLALALPVQALADEPRAPSLSTLSEFIEEIRDDSGDTLRGVYVPGVMAYPIIQQPAGNAGYVSNRDAELTQFRMASAYGTVGLLAHNYLAGASFQNIERGNVIILVYGDGRTQTFLVEDIQRYQALQPFSPYSNFRDLDTESILTAEQLFNKVYRGDFHLTLQTCIEHEGNLSWGRLFIIAKPFTPVKEKALDLVRQQYREILAIQ